MTEQAKLLPCPFCLGTKHLEVVNESYNSPGCLHERHRASCNVCNLDMWRSTRKEVIAAWNKRAAIPVPPELLEWLVDLAAENKLQPECRDWDCEDGQRLKRAEVLLRGSDGRRKRAESNDDRAESNDDDAVSLVRVGDEIDGTLHSHIGAALSERDALAARVKELEAERDELRDKLKHACIDNDRLRYEKALEGGEG